MPVVPPTSPPSPDSLPLAGVRVLDLTSSVAGPFCTQLLGALGADVIKVEPPLRGDDTRAWGPPFWDGHSAMFLAMNANKRSIGLNLRSEPGIAIALQLAERCDVLVQSMRPGLCDRLGLGYPAIRALNPGVIYCNIGAYGSRSPMSDQPGYDPLMQAAGGIMSVTGTPGGEPVRAGVSIVDQGTSLWATVGILRGAARPRSGRRRVRGRYVVVRDRDRLDGVPPREPPGHRPRARPGGIAIRRDRTLRGVRGRRRVADGGRPERWPVRRPVRRARPARAGADARFATNPDRVANREPLAAAIGARIATEPVEVWLERLGAASLPVAPVLNAGQVAAHPQTAALGMLAAVPGHAVEDLRLVAPSLSFDAHRPAPRSAPPGLGEHTAAICAELGIDAERLAELRAEGVVT